MISDPYRINVSGYVNDQYVDIVGTALITVNSDGSESYSNFIPSQEYKYDEVRMG